jgi:hypothetical protein
MSELLVQRDEFFLQNGDAAQAGCFAGAGAEVVGGFLLPMTMVRSIRPIALAVEPAGGGFAVVADLGEDFFQAREVGGGFQNGGEAVLAGE